MVDPHTHPVTICIGIACRLIANAQRRSLSDQIIKTALDRFRVDVIDPVVAGKVAIFLKGEHGSTIGTSAVFIGAAPVGLFARDGLVPVEIQQGLLDGHVHPLFMSRAGNDLQ